MNMKMFQQKKLRKHKAMNNSTCAYVYKKETAQHLEV
jgi:hypothetical protein